MSDWYQRNSCPSTSSGYSTVINSKMLLNILRKKTRGGSDICRKNLVDVWSQIVQSLIQLVRIIIRPLFSFQQPECIRCFHGDVTKENQQLSGLESFEFTECEKEVGFLFHEFCGSHACSLWMGLTAT